MVLIDEAEWSAIVLTEQRVRVSPNRVRIPAVALVRPGAHPDVLTEPPLLAVEILSPEDTYSEIQERASDFLAMGVPAIWIIDPKTRTGRTCEGQAWTAASRLSVPGTAICLDLPEIFRRLGQQGTPS